MSDQTPGSAVQRIMFWPPIEEELGFSAVARVGNTLYLSGIIGHDGGAMPADPARQWELAYKNIAEVLATHGATMNDVASERVNFTAAMTAIDPAVRRKIRGDAYGTTFPASTWIQVVALIVPDAMIEIEIVAVLPSAQ